MQATIYLGGGCFWGTQKYFDLIKGVISTEVGYANGNSQKTDYYSIKKTNHCEVVKIVYENSMIDLETILNAFYKVIDPTSINKQGNDVGEQYRTGIYYTEKAQLEVIEKSINDLQKQHEQKIAIEIYEIENYVTAEQYHQKYLDKNPHGYCHLNQKHFDLAKLIKNK